MKIPAFPFTVTDWSKVAPTTHAGETGQALWRTLDIGDLRVRMVEWAEVQKLPPKEKKPKVAKKAPARTSGPR